jgi:hypothetical protein
MTLYAKKKLNVSNNIKNFISAKKIPFLAKNGTFIIIKPQIITSLILLFMQIALNRAHNLILILKIILSAINIGNL